jgi:hypothetical protein
MRITDHEKKVVCIMGSTMVKTNGIYTSIIELKTWQFFWHRQKIKQIYMSSLTWRNFLSSLFSFAVMGGMS